MNQSTGHAFTVSGGTQVETVFDNTSAIPGDGDADPVLNWGPLFVSFSTSNYAVSLNEVQLLLSTSDPTLTGSITVGLYDTILSNFSDPNYNPIPFGPGTLLYTLTTIDNTSLTTTPTLVSITPTDVLLSANNRYWIGLVANSDASGWGNGGILWSWTLDDSGTGVSTEYFGYSIPSIIGPAIWGPYIMKITEKGAWSGGTWGPGTFSSDLLTAWTENQGISYVKSNNIFTTTGTVRIG